MDGAPRASAIRRAWGNGDVVEIANPANVGHASIATLKRAQANASPESRTLLPLAAIAADRWRALTERAIEPNGFYLPDWALAIDASARGRTDGSALDAWSDAEPGAARLVGLMPAISLWRAYKIPLPALASADPYGTLCTPLLDREMPDEAARALMRQARDAGAHALILRDVTLDGAVMKTFAGVLERGGMHPRLLQTHARASLDATRDADEILRAALGTKKLKELRRQRHRLAEHGDVSFEVARTPGRCRARARDIFGPGSQRLESPARHRAHAGRRRRCFHPPRRGSTRGKRPMRNRRAASAGPSPVAAAIVLRHRDRAFYFKLGVDERFAKFSPGVQLTLDVTRHLCADPAIAMVDGDGRRRSSDVINPDLARAACVIERRAGSPLRAVTIAMVALIHAAMHLRKHVREPARRAVHLIRQLREKRT